ncbi:MAG: EamA family transporter [Meiothermus sp.]
MLNVQGGAAFAKTLFPLVGPAGAVALRVGLSALVLMLLQPRLREVPPEAWRIIVSYGRGAGMHEPRFLHVLKLLALPLGLAVTLDFAGPLALALVLSRRAMDAMWVALAALGIVLIVPHTNGQAVSPIGVILALTAEALWAMHIVIGKKVAQRVPGMTGVVAGMLVATLVSVPFGVWQAGTELLRPQTLLIGLGVAALSSALPYALEFQALRVMPAGVFGVTMSVKPAVAALTGWVVLDEHLTPQQWLAMLCVIAASAGMNLTTKKKTGG